MVDPQRRAQHFTDEQLDRLAEITPEDIERAKLAWRQDAPPQFRDLLDAVLEDEPSTSPTSLPEAS